MMCILKMCAVQRDLQKLIVFRKYLASVSARHAVSRHFIGLLVVYIIWREIPQRLAQFLVKSP